MKPSILIVSANYYPKISQKLIDGATRELVNRKVLSSNYLKINKKELVKLVPGVFEIPVLIKKYIKNFDAFIALGCIIKGKTPHFDFISRTTITAIMSLSIKYNKPIGNGIITCLNKKQALERSDQRKKNKGCEAANAVLSVLGIFNKKESTVDIK